MREDLNLVVRKVRLGGGNLCPVIDEEERAQELLANPHGQVAANRRDNRRTDNQNRHGCRQNAPETPDPEILEANAPRDAELAHEQRRNKEARQNKEHVHAQVAAGQHIAKEVINNHGEYRQAAQAVKPRHQTQPGACLDRRGKRPLADAPITAVPPAPAESARAGAPTEVMPAAAGTDKAEVRDAVANAAARDSHDPSDQGPGRPSESDPDVAAQHPDVSQTEVMNAVDEAPRTIWRDDHPTTRWGKLWTLGGRVRGSTTGLLVGLAVTGLLLLFSANPEDADAGWLSPSYWTSKSSETESAATTAPATTAATQPEESVEPTQETVEQPTDASEATATDGPTAAQDNGTTAEQATTTARRERAARRDREDEETPAATTRAGTTAPAEEPTVEPTGAAEQPTGAAAVTGDAEATAAQ